MPNRKLISQKPITHSPNSSGRRGSGASSASAAPITRLASRPPQAIRTSMNDWPSSGRRPGAQRGEHHAQMQQHGHRAEQQGRKPQHDRRLRRGAFQRVGKQSRGGERRQHDRAGGERARHELPAIGRRFGQRKHRHQDVRRAECWHGPSAQPPRCASRQHRLPRGAAASRARLRPAPARQKSTTASDTIADQPCATTPGMPRAPSRLRTISTPHAASVATTAAAPAASSAGVANPMPSASATTPGVKIHQIAASR